MRTLRTPLAGSGRDVSIGSKQGAQQFPGMGLLALRLHDGKHHAGLGAVGDHADDVEEEALARRQGVELFGFVEVAGPAVPGHPPAAGLDDLAGALEVPDFALEFGRRPPSSWPPRRRGCAGGQAGGRGGGSPCHRRRRSGLTTMVSGASGSSSRVAAGRRG